MWTWLASLLTGPIINAGIKAYETKLKSQNTSENIAANLAMRELDVQRREIEVESEYRRARSSPTRLGFCDGAAGRGAGAAANEGERLDMAP
jgi:hypothetical protein